MKLRHPIQFGSQLIEELAFRPVTAKDIRHLKRVPGEEIGFSLTLAGRLTGQPDAVIDKLTGEDLTEVFELTAVFTNGGRSTGDEPSQS